MTKEGASAIEKNTSWENLEELYLPGNKIGSVFAGAIAKKTTWIRLRVFDLMWIELVLKEA